MCRLSRNVLCVSVFAASLLIMACPDPYNPPPYPEVISNYIGRVSENLFKNGDAEDAEVCCPFWTEGSSVSLVQNGTSGNCWKISQEDENYEYHELYADLTDFYGRGKSYLVSFKAKADLEAADEYLSEGELLSFQYDVYSGAVKRWTVAHNCELYDFEGSDGIIGPWDGSFLTDEFFSEELNVELSGKDSIILKDGWKEYNFVIPATEVDRIIKNTGLYRLYIRFYAGAGKRGYSYLIDDFCIKDLNVELERTGRTCPLDY